MIIDMKTEFINEKVNLSFSFYGNGSTAIQMASLTGEPMGKATVALERMPRPGFVFLKGWSENEGVPEALVKAGIVELTGCTIATGRCEAQEARMLKAD